MLAGAPTPKLAVTWHRATIQEALQSDLPPTRPSGSWQRLPSSSLLFSLPPTHLPNSQELPKLTGPVFTYPQSCNAQRVQLLTPRPGPAFCQVPQEWHFKGSSIHQLWQETWCLSTHSSQLPWGLYAALRACPARTLSNSDVQSCRCVPSTVATGSMCFPTSYSTPPKSPRAGRQQPSKLTLHLSR